MCAGLDRLFSLRHILVHERPEKPVYEPEEVEAILRAAAVFAWAADEAFTQILYGKVPLTNADMKHAAREEGERLKAELDRVLEQISAGQDEEGRKLLEDAQNCWTSYRDAQCALRADLTRGGSMSGLLWLHEARDLTKTRLDQMRWYLDREEGEL
jgi:uncharacterized protein YecT (DUF1311 family)